MWDASSELYLKSSSTCPKEKGKTRVGQSFRILPKKFVNNTNVAPYTRPVRTVQWEGRNLFPLYPIKSIIVSDNAQELYSYIF